VPFIITQQVQPALHIIIMQSQQAWIMSQHLGSPLVQVMQTPLSVISHLHMPMVILQQQTIMPFIMQQQLHMVPCSIVHRFCIMLQAMVSSQVQVIFMPPATFSNLKVQRGTIIMFMPVGMPMVPMVGVLIPGVPVMFMRSIIMAFIMAGLLVRVLSSRNLIALLRLRDRYRPYKEEYHLQLVSSPDCVKDTIRHELLLET
jgi:hypothetical protein